MRQPDAAARHATALPAATPADVVRQLMTQPRSPPIHAVLQGNAGHGGGPLVPRTVFAIAVELARLEPGVARPLNRMLTDPSTAQCHRIPHLHEAGEPARSGSDRRATQYNPHSGLRGAV